MNLSIGGWMNVSTDIAFDGNDCNTNIPAFPLSNKTVRNAIKVIINQSRPAASRTSSATAAAKPVQASIKIVISWLVLATQLFFQILAITSAQEFTLPLKESNHRAIRLERHLEAADPAYNKALEFLLEVSADRIWGRVIQQVLIALVLPVRSHGLHQQDFHSAPGTIVVRLIDEADDRVTLRYDQRKSWYAS
jgi:hypothetical protein